MPAPLPGSGGTGGFTSGFIGKGPGPTPMMPVSFLNGGGAFGRSGGGGLLGGFGGSMMDAFRKRRMQQQGAAPMPGGGYSYENDPMSGVAGYKGPEQMLNFRSQIEKGGGEWEPQRYQQVHDTMRSLRGGLFSPQRQRVQTGADFGGIDPIRKMLMARYGGGM